MGAPKARNQPTSDLSAAVSQALPRVLGHSGEDQQHSACPRGADILAGPHSGRKSRLQSLACTCKTTRWAGASHRWTHAAETLPKHILPTVETSYSLFKRWLFCGCCARAPDSHSASRTNKAHWLYRTLWPGLHGCDPRVIFTLLSG